MCGMRVLAAAIMLGSAFGCHHTDFDPNLAGPPYPYALHTTDTLSVEVFRDNTDITIVNATAESWTDAVLWINQRFSLPIRRIDAGERVTLDLSSFRDDIGESFPAGGMFATRRNMPVRLVELQTEPEGPLVGFVSIRQSEGE